MARCAPPEVEPTEYERRTLANLRRGDWGDLGMSLADVWLEGEHPETQIVLVLQIELAPKGRYVHRRDLWHPGTDSNPERNTAHITLNIEEGSPHGRRRGREEGWVVEPKPARAGAQPRRPDLERPLSAAELDRLARGSARSMPWPRPAESDPDLHERCLLAVFQGEWPGFRGRLVDSWLEGEYPDTSIVFVLRLRAFHEEMIFRTRLWDTGPLPPGVTWRSLGASSLGTQVCDWYHEMILGKVETQRERQPAEPGSTPRRPKLP